MEVDGLAQQLRAFAAERDWEQFHDPKNLAMALAAEAGELLEVFMWMSTDQVRRPLEPVDLEAASQELADILIYLVRLADVLEVDLSSAVDHKLAQNALRYPVETSRGDPTKHSRRLQ